MRQYLMPPELREAIVDEIEIIATTVPGILEPGEHFDRSDLIHGIDDVDLVTMLLKVQLIAGAQSAYGDITVSYNEPEDKPMIDDEDDEYDTELEMGIEEEMEHTDDPAVAEQIALDHLREDPSYYTKLKSVMDLDFNYGEELYIKLSKYFPDEESDRLSDDQFEVFKGYALDYLIDNYDREDVDAILDNPEFAEEVADIVWNYAMQDFYGNGDKEGHTFPLDIDLDSLDTYELRELALQFEPDLDVTGMGWDELYDLVKVMQDEKYNTNESKEYTVAEALFQKLWPILTGKDGARHIENLQLLLPEAKTNSGKQFVWEIVDGLPEEVLEMYLAEADSIIKDQDSDTEVIAEAVVDTYEAEDAADQFGFAYDGCHKIYVLQDEQDVTEAIDDGYEIFPGEQLGEIYDDSCMLRFVYNWKLTKTYISQGDNSYDESCKTSNKDIITEEEVIAESSNARYIQIKVHSGIGADGFDLEVIDKDGEVLYSNDYRYGYNANYDKAWGTAKAPYVTDIINSICTEYSLTVADVTVSAGRNVFQGKEVGQDYVTDFIADYLPMDDTKHMSASIRGTNK